jgi:hypothetical protein
MMELTTGTKQKISSSMTNESISIERHNNIFHKIISASKILPIFPSPSSLSSNVRRTLRPRTGRIHPTLHRRNRSSSTLLLLRLNASKSESFEKKNIKEDRSTMSLCSVTSDEYEFDDIADSFEDIIILPDPSSSAHDGRRHYNSNSPIPEMISQSFDTATSSNTSSDSIPQTPNTVRLQMRPSPFNALRSSIDGSCETYYEYDGDDEREQYVIDEDMENAPYYIWNPNSSIDYVSSPSSNGMIPAVASFDSIHDVTTEYYNHYATNRCTGPVIVDCDYNNNDNTIQSPRTPPTTTNNIHRRLLSPPILQLKPKNVIYLPIMEHDGWESSSDIIQTATSAATATSSCINHHIQHILMPDDF